MGIEDEKDTGGEGGAGGEEKQTLQEKAFAAFDEGVSEADDALPAQGNAGDGGDPDDGEGDGAGDDAGGEGDNETPEQRAQREKDEADAALKAEDDKAVAELGLKGRSEVRFRELSAKARESGTKLEAIGGDETVEIITKLGGRDGLHRALRDANDQRQWDQKLNEIGCTPEQFGTAIGVIAGFNSSDPTVLRSTRDALIQQVAYIDERLGEKTDRHDPLSAHPDLKRKVETGALDEEDALEMARLRAGGKQAQEQQQTLTATQRAQQEQQEALGQLQALGAELQAADGPDVFKRKMAAIRAELDEDLPELPPAKWAERARKLYSRVQLAPAAAPAQRQSPRVGKAPVRQSHVTQGRQVHTNTPTNPMDAFDQGVAEAREMGL